MIIYFRKPGSLLIKTKWKFVLLLCLLFLIIAANFTWMIYMFFTDTLFSQWILFAVTGIIYGLSSWLTIGMIIDRRKWKKMQVVHIEYETTIVVDDIFFYAKNVTVNFSRELYSTAILEKTTLSYCIISNNSLWQVSPKATAIFKQQPMGIGSVIQIKAYEINGQRRILDASVITPAPEKALANESGNTVMEKYWGAQPVRISKKGEPIFQDESYTDPDFLEEDFGANNIEYSLISGLIDKANALKKSHYTIRVAERLIAVDWHRFNELKVGDKMGSEF